MARPGPEVPGYKLYTGGPGKVGRPSYFVPIVSAGRPVTISAVTPILAKGSAPAGLFFFLCDPGSGGSVDIEDLTQTGCGHPTPFHQVAEKPDGPWVGLAIIPLSAGTVRINGFRVSYRDNGRHSLDTGGPIEVIAQT